MAYIHDFEREDTKHRRMSGVPTSNYDAWDNPTVTASNDSQKSFTRKTAESEFKRIHF